MAAVEQATGERRKERRLEPAVRLLCGNYLPARGAGTAGRLADDRLKRKETPMRRSLSLDFSQPPELVPEGRYPVQVDAVTLREAKSSGQPILRWRLIITAGPYADTPVWMWTSLSPKAMWRIEKLWRALGIPSGPLVTDDQTQLVIEPRLSGLCAVAIVEHYQLDGETRARACELLADHRQN
jgi:Protein of unknown function (DUF669)